MKTLILILIIVIIASALGFLAYSSFLRNNYVVSNEVPYGGMMGGMKTVNIQSAIELMKNPPAYAHVFVNNNSIVFTSKDINLVVLTMGHKRAENLTGLQSPPHDVFVIYGLIDPKLIIPAGAVIYITVINLDDNMYHNFVITTESPPYPYNVMMGEGMMSGFVAMMPLLPPANYQNGYAYEFSYTVQLSQAGIYWYICTYPGHAQEGMYGEMIVIG